MIEIGILTYKTGIFAEHPQHLPKNKKLPENWKTPLTNLPALSIISMLPRESGGTGRRARLRGVWFTPYGFKSRLSHQYQANKPKGFPLGLFFVRGDCVHTVSLVSRIPAAIFPNYDRKNTMAVKIPAVIIPKPERAVATGNPPAMETRFRP